MSVTHDGIACRIPLSVPRLVGALVLLDGGALLGWAVSPLGGAALGLVGLLVLVNLFGERRVRVIESKLLVEDTHLIMGLLIGPARRRIGWEEVRSLRVETRKGRGRLVAETGGEPFETAEGAAAADLEALRARAESAWKKHRANVG